LLYKCFRLAKDLNSFLASLEKHLKYYWILLYVEDYR
jgi:hypothetical protein